jgi:hypothetical protein
MNGIDGYCKHGKIFRNCYTCHIEHNPPKTEVDTLHEMISELKIRVSKLEEYKRLQDDNNKGFQYFSELAHKHYLDLHTRTEKLENSPFGKSATYHPLFKRLSELEEWTRKEEDAIRDKLKNLDEHRKKQIDENRAVSKHLSEIDVRLYKIEKPRITFDPGIWNTTEVRFVGAIPQPKQTLCMDKFTNPTPITFEQAFKAFMDLKTIKRKNGVRYVLQDQSFTTFSPDDIIATDWEICG